jgi:hypothetical protein
MRDLRQGLSVSGKDKEKLIGCLERGEIAPSQHLSSLLRELDARRTPEALGHFSASLATPTDRMRRPGRTDLHAVTRSYSPMRRTTSTANSKRNATRPGKESARSASRKSARGSTKSLRTRGRHSRGKKPEP